MLDQSYRAIQTQVHPDRHAAAGAAGRRASLASATAVNDAYRVLRDPVQRAKALLALHGVDVAFETNTQMPTDFLLQQLEWREELEGASSRKSIPGLDALRATLGREREALQAELADVIDGRKDYAGAAEAVRKLMFLQRLDEEVGAAYEEIE
jgi:molecular chaperone HscB